MGGQVGSSGGGNVNMAGSKSSSAIPSNQQQQQSSYQTTSTNQLFNYDNDEYEAEIAFRYAIKRINKDRNILPNTTLIYDIEVKRMKEWRKKNQLILKFCSSIYHVMIVFMQPKRLVN